MSNIPKFSVLQDEGNFIVEIESGKYKGAQYSYNDIELRDKHLTYNLEVYNDDGFADNIKFINTTKNIMNHILTSFIENHKIGETSE